MIADATLTLALLLLAHLVSDFVIQTDRIATEKFGTGRRAWRGLGKHVLGVGVCLIPVVVAFGGPGLAFLVVVTFSHAVIDRSKIIWTRRVEAGALTEAHRAHAGSMPAEALGMSWTAKPAALFILDQLVHVVILGWAWGLFLAGTPLTPLWTDLATRVAAGPGTWDPALVHRVVVWAVVLVDLLIVNVRAGSLFVATLVRPRAMVGYDPTGDAPSTGSPARVGEAIGVLERLLIVAFVLSGAEAAIGLRHRRQDARPFQAARRSRLRRVLPPRHAGQRDRGDRERTPRPGRARLIRPMALRPHPDRVPRVRRPARGAPAAVGARPGFEAPHERGVPGRGRRGARGRHPGRADRDPHPRHGAPPRSADGPGRRGRGGDRRRGLRDDRRQSAGRRSRPSSGRSPSRCAGCRSSSSPSSRRGILAPPCGARSRVAGTGVSGQHPGRLRTGRVAGRTCGSSASRS